LFLEREYKDREISAITYFLKRKGLSRAERHAVILHLSYHYTSTPGKNRMENLAIDGYFKHVSNRNQLKERVKDRE